MEPTVQSRVVRDAFGHMLVDHPFMPNSTTIAQPTSPTKINVIVPTIPIAHARIMNLVFLSLGGSLNFLIIIVIVSKSSMRTSSNLYIVSMACSNLLILMEALEEVLRWFFDVHMMLNMDYVCLVNFDVSVVTIAILKFMQYVNIFEQHTPFGRVLLRRYTTIKSIFLVWVACTISIALGLHIYDFFEGDMADMYVWVTFMFTVLPFIIFVVLDYLIIYELMILKAIEGRWRVKELRHYYLLVIIAIFFFLIRAPYRIARAINFIEPKALCCTDSKREVLYFMAKTFPIIFAITYISFSVEFRKSLQEILRCRCFFPNKTLTDVNV